mgnify:CR=1 FL=1
MVGYLVGDNGRVRNSMMSHTSGCVCVCVCMRVYVYCMRIGEAGRPVPEALVLVLDSAYIKAVNEADGM